MPLTLTPKFLSPETAKRKVNTKVKGNTRPKDNRTLALPEGPEESALAQMRTVAYINTNDDKKKANALDVFLDDVEQGQKSHQELESEMQEFQLLRHSGWSGINKMKNVEWAGQDPESYKKEVVGSDKRDQELTGVSQDIITAPGKAASESEGKTSRAT